MNSNKKKRLEIQLKDIPRLKKVFILHTVINIIYVIVIMCILKFSNSLLFHLVLVPFCMLLMYQLYRNSVGWNKLLEVEQTLKRKVKKGKKVGV